MGVINWSFTALVFGMACVVISDRVEAKDFVEGVD